MTTKRKKSGAAPAKKAKKVSDARLIEMGRDYEALRLAAKEADDARKKAGEAIIKQFELRGKTKAIEVEGQRLTKTQTETTIYDYHGFKADLDRKTFNRIKADVLDPARIGVEMAKGTISKAVFRRNTTVRKNAAYPTFSRVKGE